MPLQSDPDQVRCPAANKDRARCILYEGHKTEHKAGVGRPWSDDEHDQLAQHHYGSPAGYPLKPGVKDSDPQPPFYAEPVDLRGQEIPHPLPPGNYTVTREQLIQMGGEVKFPPWSDDLSELRDPVDMIKVEPGDEADVAIERADDLMADAAVALRTADNLGSETSSWKITREYCRADSHSQLATAQAAYASAVELRKIAEILAANHAWIENSE